MKSHIAKTSRITSAVVSIAMTAVLLTACGDEKPAEATETANGTYGNGSSTFTQQVFSLNMLSNISAIYNGQNVNFWNATASAIDSVLNDPGVQGIIGNWQCVWGPVVNSSGDTANNTMYIARKTGTDTFVVAIAGTDPASSFDWWFEDGDVVPYPWNKGNSATGNVTLATGTGLEELKEMTYTNDSTKPITAVGFLQSQMGNDSMHIWVTGHSLGGALSPAFGLYLNDTFKRMASPPKAGISVLAVAGATPGDSTFISYYNQQLGASTTRVWNTRDVVPHGFEESMLSEVTTLLKTQPDTIGAFPVLTLGIPLKTLEFAVRKCNYTQLSPPANVISFTSNFYLNDSIPPDTSKTPVPDTDYEKQLLFQHIPAYGVYFNTFPFQQAVQRVLGLRAPFFTESGYLVPVFDTSAHLVN